MRHAVARKLACLAGAALLWTLCTSANATADVAGQTFDDATLATLLERIRELDEALRDGLDESTAELMQRLPMLWRELADLERRLQRSLPALREQLEALERELRNWPPPSRSPEPAIMAV